MVHGLAGSLAVGPRKQAGDMTQTVKLQDVRNEKRLFEPWPCSSGMNHNVTILTEWCLECDGWKVKK